jgi:hypothetical protein
MTAQATRRRGRARALRTTPAGLCLAAVVVLALTACSTGSVASPPGGIDGLVIPTPSPQADDFVRSVTNPWFPLVPGTRSVYVVNDLDGRHRLVVTVTPGPVVAGVRTTARVSTQRGRSTTDWYAQDRRGNVWWFGRAGEWRAGTAGAEAGLAMPRDPRVGDGWAMGYADGADVEVATVVTRSADLAVPEGDHSGVLLLDVVSPATGVDRDVFYATGVGLLQEDTQHGGYRDAQLAKVARAGGSP